MHEEPLHEMKPTTRFTDRVADYVRFRPDYPEDAINTMLSGLGYAGMLTIADVGAGTGILSWQLATRGALIVAVEPNEDMRNAIEPHDRILTQDGAAEATGLLDESVHLVACGQSFHWFDPTFALPEFRRVLKGLGRLALIWNMRDHDDELSCAYAAALRSASNDHPATRHMISIECVKESPLFENFREFAFPHEQRLSANGLIGRARSASYCPPSGPKYQQLVEELTHLHARFADAEGIVTFRYRTQLFLCEPAMLDNQAST